MYQQRGVVSLVLFCKNFITHYNSVNYDCWTLLYKGEVVINYFKYQLYQLFFKGVSTLILVYIYIYCCPINAKSRFEPIAVQ